MKKLLLFVVLAGLFFGIFIGARNSALNSLKEEVPEIQIETSYIDELMVPVAEIDTLNPILTNNTQVSDVLRLVYEPLFGFDASNRLVGSLGLDYMEKDDASWVITLRKNVKWHSEKDFSADDVIFTIKSIKSNEKSPYYNNVKNIDHVDKLDDNSINIFLSQKDSFLPYKLYFPIIPKYYFSESLNDKEKTNRPIGTGPYKFLSSDDDVITLVFNNEWWKGVTPKLNTIYLKKYQTYGEAIKAFKSNEVDIITTSMESWEKKFGVIGINCYRYENEKFDLLIPNCDKAVLNDSAVRRAILYAINRDNIIDDAFEKNASKQDMMIHSYSWANDESAEVEYSIDKAKQLLTNGSWKYSNSSWSKNINGKTYSLKLNLMIDKENEKKKQSAKIIKENLDSIGIKISIVEVDTKTFVKNIESRNFDLAYGTLDTVNEFDVIELLTKSNYANYKSELLNEKISKLFLLNENIEGDTRDFYVNCKNEMPYIGLYYKCNTLLTNKAVKGTIEPTKYNPYNYIWTWSK